MDLKSDRRGFGVNSEPSRKKKKAPHPAWRAFIEVNEPGDKTDNCELLTTAQVIDRLQAMVFTECSEERIFKAMKLEGFNMTMVGDQAYWIIKSRGSTSSP